MLYEIKDLVFSYRTSNKPVLNLSLIHIWKGEKDPGRGVKRT